jgi:formylglycine-generating enzyme required for sulfatase activity
VERVNFHDVERFIGKLEELTSRHFRLPTEAEWEYACRAGTTTPFHTGESITTAQANFDGRYPYPGTPSGIYREGPTPVASFPPSPWGLHDMHGNVWEWTADWHCPYPEASVTDPEPACVSKFRVIRGGSWHFDANSTRCALRYTHEPRDLGFSLGFRLVMEIR